MGRSTPSTFALPPEAADLPDPLIRRGDLEGELDLERCFGRAGPVEVEVGFGKGRFLLEEAARRPDTRFLGIERAAPYVRFVRHRALAAGLSNVRLLAGDATDALRRLLAPASVDQVHVLFPDPWPKRRHHKRRIVQPDLVRAVARVLRPGGRLNIVTDHDDYAAAIRATVARSDDLEAEAECAIADDLAARTHYATKLAAAGASFHAHTWRRRAARP